MMYLCEDGPIEGERINSKDVGGPYWWGESVNIPVYGPTPDDMEIAVYVLHPFLRLRFKGYNAKDD